MQIDLIEGGVCAPKGFKASGVHCGIRKNKLKKDLALIYSSQICNAAAVFTTNKVKGAPITVSSENLTFTDGKARAIVCNSGNANTCAPNGIEIAAKTCKLLGEELGIGEKEIIIASTGVIGEPLSIEPFENGIPKLVRKLAPNGSTKAAQAIMTTDTVEKEVAASFVIGNKQCQIGGIAKGSGMINPNMATMLCFLTTDVSISSEMLKKALLRDTQDTFNQISVDGDTSTNDTVAILANGMAENVEITCEGQDFDLFCDALSAVTVQLCRKLAKDGEGATKLIECVVSGAPDKKTAQIVSKTVIGSPLFKTAMFGEDANWGRILCAIGYAEADFDIGCVDVVISSMNGNVEVCKNAAYHPYSEKSAAHVLRANEIKILISLNQGPESAMAWGCDLTYDYVKINGDYRS